MRWLQYLALSAVLTLGLSISAFAKADHTDEGKFNLTTPATIGSTVLQPGHYKAEWVGPNEDVRVSILSHGKVVATAQGRVVEHNEKAAYDSVTVKKQANNSERLEEIDFNNRKAALVLFRG
jgi:hypothetical protein